MTDDNRNLDKVTYAKRVFGAKYGVKIQRPYKSFPEWFYFRTKIGADAYNDGELKGKGEVVPL